MKTTHSFLFVAALGLPFLASGQAPAPAPAQPPAAALVSPEIAADGRVTFRLRAPGAREVSVAGIPAPLAMSKDADGVWSATTPNALAPDIYSYSFTVDGLRIPDPSNMTNTGVGIMGATSYLQIPGVPWTNSNAPHGAVAKHVYQSAIIGGPETYYVYTPPSYDPKRKAAYPVLVTLHGLAAGTAASAGDWIAQGGANLTLDTLIGEGKAVPMILISPAANGNTQGNRGAAAGFPNFTRALIEEILPQVEKQYNATSKASERAITGLSAGAAQSLLLLNRLDKFQWIGSFSPGFDMFTPRWGTPAMERTVNGQRPLLEPGEFEANFPKLEAAANSQIKLLYITCGTADDHLNLTRQFKAFLEARKIKITNYSEPEGVQHVWTFWRPQLAAFAPLLFKPAN